MEAAFSPHAGTLGMRRLHRFLETLPALLSWSIILGMIALMLFEPVIAALIIIAFVLSWLLRTIHSNLLLLLSFVRLYAEQSVDWMERIRRMGDLPGYLAELQQEPRGKTLRQRLSKSNLIRDLRALRSHGLPSPRWEEVFHVVILPIARERREIFEAGVASIARGRFPAGKILMVLAVEERAPAEVKADAAAVARELGAQFLELLVVIHPDGIPGEARVKGANATYAARAAAERLTTRGIALENVVVSCFDADTVISADYFGCLTYHFMINPRRTRASFQPIPVYQNNFWDAPGFSRILDISNSFSRIQEATAPEKLVTFSSHSMSFKALVDIGYWPVDMISDDSSIYWKALLHFKGDYHVVPMYVTVSMDLAQAETWWKTVRNAYRQRRRWAWGVEVFPIVMSTFLTTRDIPLSVRIVQSWRLLQAHVSWATWPFLLSVMSWLPGLVIALGHSHSIVRYSEPQVLSTMFNLSLASFALYALLSQIFLPREKGKYRVFKRIAHILEWLLVPPISIVFGAIPALDAQTRLMLGKYMEFWVTIKTRREHGRA